MFIPEKKKSQEKQNKTITSNSNLICFLTFQDLLSPPKKIAATIPKMQEQESTKCKEKLCLGERRKDIFLTSLSHLCFIG